jgi:uncharacterized membrane protein
MQDLSGNEIYILPLIVGLVTMLVSWITLRYPPKKINIIYGYRTVRSMRSQEQWDKAQRLASRYFGISGLCMLLGGLVIWLAGNYISETTGGVLVVAMLLAALFTPIYLIEKKLK